MQRITYRRRVSVADVACTVAVWTAWVFIIAAIILAFCAATWVIA
jgi:hypothetical protein